MTPLAKRLPRDFKNNLGKYLGIFILMAFATAFTSGFLASAASIKDISDGMRENYQVEDFYLTTMYEMDEDDIDVIEAHGARVFENFSRDVPLTFEGETRDMSVRLYKNRTGDFDAAIYAEGRAPSSDHEIAFDRVFCANHSLELGDMVCVDGEDFELVGIMTLSDYTVTYKSSGDILFNAVTFTVAQITDESYERIVGDTSIFTYSVLLDDRDMELADRISLEEEIVDELVDRDATVTNLIDAENNIGLTFASGDVEQDMWMWVIILIVLVVVMAFVFVVLTDATIEQESSAIGTLLASGYRKGELIRHYLVLPALVGLLGIAVGNLAGLTVLRGPMQGLYYNSYGFPPFEYHFHGSVFALTSLLPFAVLLLITSLGLVRKLGATPLQFLRHEASRKTRKGGMRLPERLPYPTRFRLRVFMRNASHFATLFVGIMLGSMLLLLGLCMLPIVDYNAELLASDVPADHLYFMKSQLKIDGTDDERRAWAAAFELKTNPDYDVLDLDLLADLGEQLEGLGVDLDDFDEGDGAESISLPPELEEAIEDSINHDVDASDPVLLATVRMLAASMGLDIEDASDEELSELIHTADMLHRQVHELPESAQDNLEGLLEDLLLIEDFEDMDTPVNQTPISDVALDQVEYFASASLALPRSIGDRSEDITVYGIQEDSRYWTDIDVAPGEVIVGEGVFEKCRIELGEEVVFTDRFTNETYRLIPTAICGNPTTMAMYLTLEDFNEIFGNDVGYYNGIASDEELPLDARYVAGEVTPDKMLSVSEQMQDSMGAIMRMITWMVIPIYLVLIYLLTKTVIDRSARAISYMKVFGYRNREINGFYIRAITITVLVSLIVCLPIIQALIGIIVPLMMADYSGNFAIEYPMSLLAEVVAIGAVTYAVVALLHVRRIRKVPLALALKVQE